MNLLPKKEKENLKKGLKYRLIIVALFLASAIFLIGFVMLLPSYFLTLGYFSKTISTDSSLGADNGNLTEEILNLPEEINSKLEFFQSNAESVTVVDSFNKIVDFLPEKVTLNSLSFSRNPASSKEKSGLVVLISGVASDRDSLVLFSTLLKDSNLFSLIEVPVSSLTKDKNLPFSMNIFIKNTK